LDCLHWDDDDRVKFGRGQSMGKAVMQRPSGRASGNSEGSPTELHSARGPISIQRRRGRRRTRGQALVEFSLILPVFILVLSGIMDFGVLLYSRITVINAAREGARAASIVADATTIPTVVTGRVKAVSSGLTTTSPTMTITSTCVAIATSPGPCTFSTTTSSQPGDAISVTVNYKYSSFFPLLFGAQIPLSATVQMVME
jgi:Flp pilus assembly protein TadG